MALFEATCLLSRPPPEVFELFIQPALLIQTAPPELALQLVEAPERLHLGARVKVRGRRWGISHRATTEVSAFVLDERLTERQVEGTFRSWEMSQRFEASDTGTRVVTSINFEPPGGLLGLTVTEALIRRELTWFLDYRTERLQEWFR